MTQFSKAFLLAILLGLSFSVAGKAQSVQPRDKADDGTFNAGATTDNPKGQDDKSQKDADANAKNEDRNSEKQDVRLLQVGHIVKVDAKKRTITIEDPEESADESQQTLGQFPRGIGRNGRRGGFGTAASRTGASAIPPNWPERKLQTKIWITDGTLIKEDGKTIPWESLKKGDVVQVSGTPKKKDLDAKEIDIVEHHGE